MAVPHGTSTTQPLEMMFQVLIFLWLSTTFPFAFAVVISNAIKQITSVHRDRDHNTILLRRMSIQAILLLGMWGLSLDSQSCLQIPSVQDRSVTHSIPVYYFDTQGHSAFNEGMGAECSVLFLLNAIFGTSLIAPASVRKPTIDLWAITNTIAYSPLPGIPVNRLLEKGNTTFTMLSSYMAVTTGDAGDFSDSWTYRNDTWDMIFPVTGLPFSQFQSFAFGQSSGFKNGTIYTLGTKLVNYSDYLYAINDTYEAGYAVINSFTLGINQIYD
ncbi:hypothetical protein BDZ45DRAFT_742711 [Acephala macrosclerotiorum]|nr:hypothetical protein BDZ45DRAFT_742711 [Acephala macrosclerotiorum]